MQCIQHCNYRSMDHSTCADTTPRTNTIRWQQIATATVTRRSKHQHQQRGRRMIKKIQRGVALRSRQRRRKRAQTPRRVLRGRPPAPQALPGLLLQLLHNQVALFSLFRSALAARTYFCFFCFFSFFLLLLSSF